MLYVVTEETIRVRYGETDQMGHAYYANYLFWFEQARGAWCRDRGFTYKSLEELGYMLPVVEVHVRYKQEIKYDDCLSVHIHLAEVRRSSLKFQYEVFNQSKSTVATEGYSWHVTMGQARHAVTIPTHIKELLLRNPLDFEKLS